LDALASFQQALNRVREDLTSGPAGSSARGEGLNPRVDVLASAVRANSELAAPFAYGLLREATALGRAHEEVARTVHALVGDLQGLIDEIRARAGAGARRYEEADSAVVAAVGRAGGGLGGGGDEGSVSAGGSVGVTG